MAHAKPHPGNTHTQRDTWNCLPRYVHTRACTHIHTAPSLWSSLINVHIWGQQRSMTAPSVAPPTPPPTTSIVLTVGLVVQAVVHLHTRARKGDLGGEVDGDTSRGHHGDPLRIWLQGAEATQPRSDQGWLRHMDWFPSQEKEQPRSLCTDRIRTRQPEAMGSTHTPLYLDLPLGGWLLSPRVI